MTSTKKNKFKKNGDNLSLLNWPQFKIKSKNYNKVSLNHQKESWIRKGHKEKEQIDRLSIDQ